mgnify:CR=1 FL=1
MVSPFKATMAPMMESTLNADTRTKMFGVFNDEFVANCFMNEDAKHDWQKGLPEIRI